MFHVEREVFMNSVEARLAIEAGEIVKVKIVASLVGAKWIIMFNTRDENNPWRYMTRSRGDSARFKSIDAAHNRIRSVGWTQEVQLSM